MTIYTDGLRQSRGVGIDALQASLGESLGATVAQAFEDLPTVSLFRMQELSDATGELPPTTETMGGFAPSGFTPDMAPERPGIAEVPIDEARAAVKEAGLDKTLHLPDQPSVKRPALDIMLARARARREREATLARGPGGILPGALSLGTSLLVSAVDPINVAAMFIPVVGDARFAKLMANAGEGVLARAGVRARVGAASGAVGMAALEPIQYAARNQEGQDYTFADALRSVMYGALLGGALHTGGGAVADLIRARRGQPVYPFREGEPFARPTAPEPAAAVRPIEPGRAGTSALEETRTSGLPIGKSAPDLPGAPAVSARAATLEKAQSLLEFIKARGGIDPNDPLLPDLLQSFGGKPPRGLVREGGQSLDRLREGAVELGYLHDEGAATGRVSTSTIDDLLQAVDTEARGTKVYPAGQEGFRTKAELEAEAERAKAEQERFEAGATADMNVLLDEAGFDKPLRKFVVRRGVDLMRREGLDAQAGLTRALEEWDVKLNPVLSALDDLPPRAREDALRASIAALHEGKPVQAGELLAAAAEGNPRLAALSAAARDWPDLPEGARFAGNGDNGPVIEGLEGRFADALAWMRAAQAGDAIGVLQHPEVPGRIDLIWGDREHGLAHIDAKHPGDADLLPALWDELHVARADEKFIELQSDKATAVIARDFAGDPKDWLLTFFQRREEGARPPGGTITSPEGYGQAGPSPASPRSGPVGPTAGPDTNIGRLRPDVEARWRALAETPEDFNEPAALDAARAADELPAPASLKREVSERVAAAERAAAEVEAEYKANEAYLPDDLKERVERELKALEVEAGDRAHVIEQGAACLAAAAGGAA